jgi:hypothetical protein
MIIPEQRLMLAVLERAVKDYTNVGDLSDEHDRRTAELFLFGEPWEGEDKESIMSFRNIADHVGLEPEDIRSRVRLIAAGELKMAKRKPGR